MEVFCTHTQEWMHLLSQQMFGSCYAGVNIEPVLLTTLPKNTGLLPAVGRERRRHIRSGRGPDSAVCTIVRTRAGDVK